MRNFLAFNLSLSLFMALVSGTALARGGESSAGGADDYRIQSAFFPTSYGEAPAPIQACYQVADGFGVSAQTLETLIKSNFKRWADYVKDKKIGDISHSRIQIRTELNLSAQCDDKTELTFYFGVLNSTTSAYLSEFEKPFGFAEMTGDSQRKGIVWIAPPQFITPEEGWYSGKVPNWNNETLASLSGLLLHEIGHVFGNQHVDGTVMSSQIGHYLANDTSSYRTQSYLGFYSNIDSQRDLYTCVECGETYVAAKSFDLISHPDSDWEHLFMRVIGKAPEGPILSIKFVRTSADDVRSEAQYQYPGSGKLIIQDLKSTYQVPVEVLTMDQGAADSAHLFQTWTNDFYQSYFYNYYGKIHALQGGDIPVSIQYNTHNVRLEITPLDESGYPRPLFVSE